MRVAVLDDEKEDAQRLVEYLTRFKNDFNVDIQIDVYQAGFDFLEEYKSQYSAVFLDIEMPGIDGLNVAHEIRLMDQSVGIIFVTNIGQYAIRGYEVNAIDYLIKPVKYYVFSERLNRAIQYFEKRQQKDLILNNGEGVYRISINEIIYIEKDINDLVFFTLKGKFKKRGSIKAFKETIKGMPFSECTNGCLVNLSKVDNIEKDRILINGIYLPLSRRLKKQFTQEYIGFAGGR